MYQLGKFWGSSTKTVKAVIVLLVVILFGLLVAPKSENLNNKMVTSTSSNAEKSESYGQQLEACEQRGIAYFSEIGSFPYLSDGRKAVEVAKDRCGRTFTAF